ncbi:hypothetical protein HMSSN036_66950 [Paenibacillus macerans]|nr:hypothetical protein HMSSN036_66950 [Paenibacillus macerans]
MFIRKNMAKERFAKRLDAYRRNKEERYRLQTLDAEQRTRGTSLEGLFLGPKAENQTLFQELVNQAIDNHCDYRRDYFSTDPISITHEHKQSNNYKMTIEGLRVKFNELLGELKLTPPFHSYRWHGHMNGDLTIPAMLGYFAGMLYNPNNVAAEASPSTTLLEMEVGNQMCIMLGYHIPEKDSDESLRGWGHITCDGTVANLESMWAARNMKYYAISIVEALKAESVFQDARDTTVKTLDGREERMIDLDYWTLLNLKMDDVLKVPEQIKRRLGDNNERIDALFNDVMNKYSLQK